MSMEDKIEVSIFERKVSDCNDKDDLLKLCKEFVNKHEPPKPEIVKEEQGTSTHSTLGNLLVQHHKYEMNVKDGYAYKVKDPKPFYRRVVLDEFEIRSQHNAILQAKRDLLNNLSIDLLNEGYIKLEEQKNMATFELELRASIGAYKL